MSDKGLSSTRNQASDEQKLWHEFTNGDLNAWERIFYIYYEDLYGYGLNLSNRPELTKDCIYELFVTIWERRDNLGRVNSIKAYLLASLRRSLLKKIERKRKYYEDKENPEYHSLRIQLSPEVLLIRDEIKAEKIEALYEALDQLPDRQKEVLYLKYFNGMSYDEIEDILSIKYQSIKNHVYRAMTRLREMMGEDITEMAISICPLLLLI